MSFVALAPQHGQAHTFQRQPVQATGGSHGHHPPHPEPVKRSARTGSWLALLVIAATLLITGLAAKSLEADAAAIGLGIYGWVLRGQARRRQSGSGPAGPQS